MKYFKKLVGERIYLSPRNSEDVEQFTEWLNDFNTTDYIGRSGASVTLDTEKEYLSSDLLFVLYTTLSALSILNCNTACSLEMSIEGSYFLI